MLYLVSTPIGNLEDISLRALRILKEVDFIASEDTRKTRKLLSHYDIKTSLISYFEHNEIKKSEQLLKKLLDGKKIAVVSDAGTPCISDPGYRIVKLAKENNITVTSIPGACAAISALILSTMPVNKFIYLGYLSHKKGKKKRQIEEVKDFNFSVVVYESCHRVKKTFEIILEVLGNIDLAVCRELTKMFEDVDVKKVEDWIEVYTNKTPKGEFVLVFVPKKV
jgi:16S rRNA (cytidine1402-2'-O)-methyltransferase